MATHRTVASCLINGNTKLPLRRANSKPNLISPTQPKPFFNDEPPRRTNGRSGPTSPKHHINEEATRWRFKYEKAEEKRKQLLTEREQARRSVNDLEKKYSHLQIKNEEMETELFERNESLTKLTTASKRLFKEYDALKNQYEVETGAMNRALADASNWYRENKVLRRRTMLLDTDSVDEGVDACEPTSTDTELENLKECVKNLSCDVAYLQAELNSAKLIEFETTESNAQLAQELEEERKRNERLLHELKDLNQSHEQIIRVSNMVKKELEELKEMVKNQKSNAVILRKEADDYKKERNVLAHQSTILLQGLQLEEGIDSLLLMQEIEELRSIIEDERNKHSVEIQGFQEKLEDQENNSHVEVLEERLKLVESELHYAVERAEKAEASLTAPPVAPPLPPPPPPPAPPMSLTPPTVPLRIKKLNRLSPPPENNQPEEITPVDGKKIPPPVGGVNDDIINQIKGGFFTLRKARNSENGSKKEREAPKAVSEMLNILGSLRRTTKNKVSLKPAPNFEDVQL